MAKYYDKAIGPKEAAELLARNYDRNRRVRQSWVNQLADMMEAGKFDPANGQTIVLSEDGTLIDGQHRLQAVIKSGKAYTFHVAEVDDATAYVTIDNGSRRQAADFLECKNSIVAASIARIGYCIEHGNAPLGTSLRGKATPKEPPSRVAIVEYANDNIERVEAFAEYATHIKKVIGAGSASAYGTALLMADLLGDGSMIADFSAGVSAGTEFKSCQMFIDAVRKGAMAGRAKDFPWLVATTLIAYECFSTFSDVTRITHQAACLNRYDKLLTEWRAKNDHQG